MRVTLGFSTVKRLMIKWMSFNEQRHLKCENAGTFWEPLADFLDFKVK